MPLVTRSHDGLVNLKNVLLLDPEMLDGSFFIHVIVTSSVPFSKRPLAKSFVEEAE